MSKHAPEDAQPGKKQKPQGPPRHSDLMSLREVATHLKVSLNEVKGWLRDGLLKGSLAGVRPADLTAFCQAHRPDLIQRQRPMTPKPSAKPVAGRVAFALTNPVAWTWVRKVTDWGRGLARRLAPRPAPEPPPPPPIEVVAEESPPPTTAEVVAAVNARDPARLRNLLEDYREQVLTAVDERQNTALHLAVLAGGYERPYLLLAAGAEVNARNQDGVTPLTLALGSRRGGWKAVADLLRERGGQE
ncbi:MAG: ankyrin repeat domain-containing protein [Candidatus Eremiobacterota bacterium]